MSMKFHSFDAYLKKRLTPEEIAEIKEEARMAYESFLALQEDVSKAVIDHMAKNEMRFNDFVKQSGKSATQVSKIIQGEANLTLATVAQLYASMGQRVHIVPDQNSH